MVSSGAVHTSLPYINTMLHYFMLFYIPQNGDTILQPQPVRLLPRAHNDLALQGSPQSMEARNVPRITELLPRIVKHGGWGWGRGQYYACSLIMHYTRVQDMAVQRKRPHFGLFQAFREPNCQKKANRDVRCTTMIMNLRVRGVISFGI